MVLFIAFHFLAGLILGRFFRVGVMIPVALVVVAESLIVANRYVLSRWYWLLLIGVVAAQAGYALAARLRPGRTTAGGDFRRPPTPHLHHVRLCLCSCLK